MACSCLEIGTSTSWLGPDPKYKHLQHRSRGDHPKSKPELMHP